MSYKLISKKSISRNQFKSKKSSSHALVTKKQVQDMLRTATQPLLKYVDTAISFTPSTGIYSNLTVITMPTAGTSSTSCAGDAIKIIGFDIYMSSRIGSTASFDTQNIRSFLVQNVQPSTSALAIGDIFDETSGSTVVNSPLSYSEKGSVFKVCSDEHLYSVSTVWKSSHIYDYSCKPRIPNCRYGTVWETGTPVLVHVFSGLAVASEVNHTGYVRMWFRDV
jgi:hypothetical protein